MSLIPHGFFPRSAFDVDNWFHPTLDVFDPFDEFDHMLSRNLQWLTRPSIMEPFPLVPRVPDKYRVTVDCAGYKPESLKTEFKDGKLVVTAREEHKHDDGSEDYSIKEFKKTYKLPDNAEVDKLASFVAGGQLVVEVPLKRAAIDSEDLFPKILDVANGQKQVNLQCAIPHGIDPSKISVTCKDRDLIIKAEDKVERPDHVSRTYYYKRCTLPENTDFNALKCHLENNRLSIEAPINSVHHHKRHVPIEHRLSAKSVTNGSK